MLLAFAVRAFYVATVAGHPAVSYPSLDARAYHERALSIASGDWLGDRIFYQDPLYPYFLALLYSVLEPGGVGVLYAQAALDALTVGLIFGLARRAFGGTAAHVAAALAAFYEMFPYYDALLLKVPLTVLLASATLLLAVRADAAATARGWLAAGAALGAAALTRGNYLLFAPVLLLWIAVERELPPLRRLLFAGACSLGLAAAILPVTIRNRVVGDDWVLVTSQAGQNFYIGNHRGNSKGTYQAPPFQRANPVYEEDDFAREGERRTGHAMKPGELSAFWARETLAEIRADPGHFVRHTLRKARLFASAYEVPDNQSIDFFEAQVTPLLRLPLPTYGLLLPLAACGAVWGRRRRPVRLLALFFLTYGGSVVLFYNMSRYRMPIVPVVIVFAAGAAVQIAQLARARAWRRLAPAGAFLLVATPLVHAEVVPRDFSIYYFNLAQAHLRDAAERRDRAAELSTAGDEEAARRTLARATALRDEAERWLRLGLEEQPRNRRLRRALGSVYVSRALESGRFGRDEEALRQAERAVAVAPSLADAHALLGAARRRLGDSEGARAALERALALEPDHARARRELARLGEGHGSAP